MGMSMENWIVLKGRVQWITRAVAYLGMLLLIPMMLLISGEVVGRWLWNKPIPGSSEISEYLLAVFMLLGVAYTQQMKAHVRVSMLTSRLGPRFEPILEVFTTLLSLLIVAILCWQGWILGIEETAVSDMLRIPQWPFKLLVSVAGATLFLELLIDLVDTVRKIAGK
jgi:TRAP-type C4-dicarboxylate transport system permease small subunit